MTRHRTGATMTVTTSPTCTGCDAYADILRQAGVDGYVVEGHVPLGAIEELLATRPAVTGIALPGMPAGSPGMPGTAPGNLEVLAFGAAGVTAFGAF